MGYLLNRLNPSAILVLGFAVIILIGTGVLSLPIATEDGKGLPFLDAFFTATSATCVTGLVVVDTADTFTMFGELSILAMIQIGGLGFMTFTTFLFIMLRKKISLKERLLLKEAFNASSTAGMVKIAKRIFIFTFVMEFLGGAVLAARFAYEMPVSKAIYYGFFHAISNFNNAGFDLMGGFRSLTEYVGDPIVVLVICTMIVTGGLGFIVINELYEYHQARRLSLHTKVVLSTTAVLLVGGAVLVFLFEYTNMKTMGTLTLPEKILGAVFHSVTPRTAGANTLPMADLTHGTLLLTIFLMFIGGGSGSTAGGIKVTTFTVLVAAIFRQLQGKEDVVLFKRRIVTETILKVMTLSLSGGFIVIAVTFLLSLTEKNYDFIVYLFEATSAFGTVGLSMGLTPELSVIGKVLIIITMFIGRVGIITIVFSIVKKTGRERYQYVKGNVMIG
ncbi:TrkH family potassium uptake protein [Lysinibacillus odysseyi]|uniref:ATP synthase subunit J n=1 Tax=Lysinibacillus odysseyi 34hs-1 = NBRC 100172 TaxID=1220589 RepID=A0A0A3IKV7_9BACI|nr:TrkH family potassium uptake protein [Lysinibacillus odysseyi]KGR85374.1 ATP synthase subunit J [Lysinibacillus odysseyi 34hs-1 = NBRC 100172]